MLRPQPANREIVLDGLGGNAIETEAEIDPMQSRVVELNVLRSPGKEEFTRIAFYRDRGYVDWDRSVVEAFANGRQALAVRLYPGRSDSTGISLRAQGSEAALTSLEVWGMRSVWEPGVIR